MQSPSYPARSPLPSLTMTGGDGRTSLRVGHWIPAAAILRTRVRPSSSHHRLAADRIVLPREWVGDSPGSGSGVLTVILIAHATTTTWSLVDGAGAPEGRHALVRGRPLPCPRQLGRQDGRRTSSARTGSRGGGSILVPAPVLGRWTNLGITSFL